MLARQTIIKRSLTTRVKVDEQCLPLKPTWSIQSLMEPMGKGIEEKDFQRLLNLSRIQCDNKEQEMEFKKDIDELTQFTKHIQLHDFKKERPLTHVWKQDMGQILRKDEEIMMEGNGRELLKYAKKKSGNFYVVKGTMPSS